MPIELDDICFNKANIIEKCLTRVFQEFEFNPSLTNRKHIDVLVMNLELACQVAIDLAMHLVSKGHFGIPQNSAEAFHFSEQKKKFKKHTAEKLAAMGGFRSVIVHFYKKMSIEVLRSIVSGRRVVFVDFATELGLKVQPTIKVSGKP